MEYEPTDAIAVLQRTPPLLDAWPGGLPDEWVRADRVDQFTQARRDSLAALVGMTLDDELLARTGTHPEFGVVTVTQLLATWVVHDATHLAQIARTLAWQYRDAVGAWRKYLTVLHA